MCGQYPAVFLLDTLFLLNSLATSAANADLEYSMPLPFPIQMGKPDSRGASITCHVAVAAQTSGKFSNPAERSNHVASNDLKKKQLADAKLPDFSCQGFWSISEEPAQGGEGRTVIPKWGLKLGFSPALPDPPRCGESWKWV